MLLLLEHSITFKVTWRNVEVDFTEIEKILIWKEIQQKRKYVNLIQHGDGVKITTNEILPPRYFLKLQKILGDQIPARFLDWRKFNFQCFLKILFKNYVLLPSYCYFVKCFWNGLFCSNICLLLRFCDVFRFTQICWFAFLF